MSKKGFKQVETRADLAAEWNSDQPDVPSLDWTTDKLIECALQAHGVIDQWEKFTSVVPAYQRLGMAIRVMEFRDDFGVGIDNRSAWGKKHGIDDTKMTRAVKIARHFKNQSIAYLSGISLNFALQRIEEAERPEKKKKGPIDPVRRLASIKKAIEGLPDALLARLAEIGGNPKKELLAEWIEIYSSLLSLQRKLEGEKIVEPLDADDLLSVPAETIET